MKKGAWNEVCLGFQKLLLNSDAQRYSQTTSIIESSAMHCIDKHFSSFNIEYQSMKMCRSLSAIVMSRNFQKARMLYMYDICTEKYLLSYT